MYELRKSRTAYNFKISTMKKVWLFEENTQFGRNKTLGKNWIVEKVSDFNYLGCNVTYNNDEHLNKKIRTFRSICGIISRTLKMKIRKEKFLKFYKVMAVPVLLYGIETWTLKNRI
jgi:hypothetical protein